MLPLDWMLPVFTLRVDFHDVRAGERVEVAAVVVLPPHRINGFRDRLCRPGRRHSKDLYNSRESSQDSISFIYSTKLTISPSCFT
jgi:hypothetical protein